jgi:hypothetical protein
VLVHAEPPAVVPRANTIVSRSCTVSRPEFVEIWVSTEWVRIATSPKRCTLVSAVRHETTRKPSSATHRLQRARYSSTDFSRSGAV